MSIYLDFAYNFVERDKLGKDFLVGSKAEKLSTVEFLRRLFGKFKLPKYVIVLEFDRFLVEYANDEEMLRLLISAFNGYSRIAEKEKSLVVFPINRFVEGKIHNTEIKMGRKTFALNRIFNERIEVKSPGWRKAYYKIS